MALNSHCFGAIEPATNAVARMRIGARTQGLNLFLVGFLVLFFELACIRWFATYVGTVLNIATAAAVTYFTYGCVQCGIAVSSALSALQAGVTSGKIGDAFKAGLITAAEDEAFAGVGDVTGFHDISFSDAIDKPGMFALNIAGHAAIGCASQAASGGSCGSGALSAGFGAVAGPATHGLDFEFGLAANAVVGGVGSVLGGGKFENGAVTAAFGYLFNACGGDCWRRATYEVTHMFGDWVAGAGPTNLYFGTGSDQANDMMDAPGVNNARDYLYNKGDPSQGVSNYAARFGLSGLWAAGASPTQQFVGSYRIDINLVASEDRDYFQFTLTNTTSLKSFAYGIFPAYERNQFGPGGNMRQTIQWIEPRR